MSSTVIFAIAILIVVGVIGGLGYVTYNILRKTDPTAEDTSVSPVADTAQDFVPVRDIKDSTFDLGGGRYRAVIECSSVNYRLKTETEKDSIEIKFQNFITAIDFPITFYIQTRKIDNTLIVRELNDNIEDLKLTNPGLVDYARMYANSISEFDKYLGDLKEKKRFVIIPLEDSFELSNLTPEERYEFAIKQLGDRVTAVIERLRSLDITAVRLDDAGLTDLLYYGYERSNATFDISEAISSGDFFAPIVSGRNVKETMSFEQQVDFELLQVQEKLQREFMDYKSRASEADKERSLEIYKKISGLRDIVNKPYKSKLEESIIEDDAEFEHRKIENKKESVREEMNVQKKMNDSKENKDEEVVSVDEKQMEQKIVDDFNIEEEIITSQTVVEDEDVDIDIDIDVDMDEDEKFQLKESISEEIVLEEDEMPEIEISDESDKYKESSFESDSNFEIDENGGESFVIDFDEDEEESRLDEIIMFD